MRPNSAATTIVILLGLALCLGVQASPAHAGAPALPRVRAASPPLSPTACESSSHRCAQLAPVRRVMPENRIGRTKRLLSLLIAESAGRGQASSPPPAQSTLRVTSLCPAPPLAASGGAHPRAP